MTDALRTQTKRRSWLTTIRANSGTRDYTGAARNPVQDSGDMLIIRIAGIAAVK